MYYYIYIIYIYIYQLCVPLFENVKLQFIQKGIFSFKTSYISVCSKTFLRLSDGVYIYICICICTYLYVYV